jgi:hypothetical protein
MAFDDLASLMIGHRHSRSGNGGLGMRIGHEGAELVDEFFFNGAIQPAAGRPVGVDDFLLAKRRLKHLVDADDVVSEWGEILFQLRFGLFGHHSGKYLDKYTFFCLVVWCVLVGELLIMVTQNSCLWHSDDVSNEITVITNQTERFADRTDAFAYQTERFADQTDDFADMRDAFAYQTERFADRTDAFACQTEHFANQTESFAYQTERFANHTERFASQTDAFANQTDDFAD